MKQFEVDLPDEVLHGFGWQETEVLRRDQLSEAQAAGLLQLDRWELLDLMGRLSCPCSAPTSRGAHTRAWIGDSPR
jgi:hypothetical protein